MDESHFLAMMACMDSFCFIKYGKKPLDMDWDEWKVAQKDFNEIWFQDAVIKKSLWQTIKDRFKTVLGVFNCRAIQKKKKI